MKGQPPRRDLTAARIGQSLMDRQVDRFTRSDFRRALQYAQSARTAFALGGDESVPPDVYLALAESSRRLAEQILDEARTTEQGRISIEQVSPVTAVEAKKLLLDAGGASRAHARSVVVTDNDAYLDSLWRAADSFDAAGDREAAREAFQDYLDGAPDTDPRRPEARYRLALTFHAQRQFSTAASIYRDLMQGRGRGSSAGDPAVGASFVGPPEPVRVEDKQDAGLWADRAIVPLAQCYLADDQPSNDAEAEELLRSVLEGTLFSPDSEEYRDALTALGEYAYRLGRVEGDAGSIRLLEEAVTRYPDHPRRSVLLYKLADSNRQLAVKIT
ncbi:MAG: tetratricopeptide repeat protein, partial [Thermoleophilia bacterium]|nr:tetratricopeptide repeat protein [Thermoleophilia bacterium]